MAKIIDINEDNVDLDGLFCKSLKKSKQGIKIKLIGLRNASKKD